MNRGIHSTCHVRPTRPVDQAELDAIYAAAYADEPFVDVVASAPATRHVHGSNFARVHVRLDPRSGRIVAIGVIDNLVKGAAGQAIQAFNLVYRPARDPRSRAAPARAVTTIATNPGTAAGRGRRRIAASDSRTALPHPSP